MDDDQFKGIVKDLYSQFKKQELLDAAKELEIGVEGNETTKALARKIVEDIEKNGIPVDLTAISETLFELLVTAEYIDENGNVISSVETEESSEEEGAVVELEPQEVPDWMCFSFADPRDPACNKCKLYDACWNERIARRPSCFGKHYNEHDAECRVCIEAPYCMKEMK